MRTLIRRILRFFGFKVLCPSTGRGTIITPLIEIHTILNGRPVYDGTLDMTFTQLQQLLSDGEMLVSMSFCKTSDLIIAEACFQDWQVDLFRTARDRGYIGTTYWYAVPRIKILELPLAI